MHKNTASYRRGNVTRPSTRRELAGVKLTPRLTDEWSLEFDAMGQIGENGSGDTLYGWSGYSGVNWKSAAQSAVIQRNHFLAGIDHGIERITVRFLG